MRIYNKRGQGYKTIVTLVLVLVIALILIGVVLVWNSMFRDITDVEPCRLSLIAQTYTKIKGQTMFNVDCPSHKNTFYKDHVELQVEDSERKRSVIYEGERKDKFDDLAKSGIDKNYGGVVNYVIAEEMRKCWYKTGKGELTLFDADWFGKKNVCLICSEIVFDDEIKSYYNYEGDLNYYLSTNDIPDGSMTYAQYLQLPVFEGLYVPFLLEKDERSEYLTFSTERLDAKNNYYIIYVSFVEAAFFDLSDAAMVAVSPMYAAYLKAIKMTESQRNGYMYMIETDDLVSLGCDQLIN